MERAQDSAFAERAVAGGRSMLRPACESASADIVEHRDDVGEGETWGKAAHPLSSSGLQAEDWV